MAPGFAGTAAEQVGNATARSARPTIWQPAPCPRITGGAKSAPDDERNQGHARAIDRNDRRHAANERRAAACHRGRLVADYRRRVCRARTTPPASTSRWSAIPRRRRKASSSRCTPPAHTEQLGYLVAHRPGFVAPTLMARKIATFDHLTNGRLAVHIITGKTDDEQQGDGDFSPKAERYRRAAEYLESDEAHLGERAAVRFRRRILPGQGRALPMCARCSSRIRCCSSAAPPTARSRWARSSATSIAIYAEPLAVHRASASPSFRAQAAAFGRTRRLQRVAPPDHRRDRRRRLGQGQPDSGGDDRQERLEPAGGRRGPGRQCRQAADELCARPGHP